MLIKPRAVEASTARWVQIAYGVFNFFLPVLGSIFDAIVLAPSKGEAAAARAMNASPTTIKVAAAIVTTVTFFAIVIALPLAIPFVFPAWQVFLIATAAAVVMRALTAWIAFEMTIAPALESGPGKAKIDKARGNIVRVALAAALVTFIGIAVALPLAAPLVFPVWQILLIAIAPSVVIGGIAWAILKTDRFKASPSKLNVDTVRGNVIRAAFWGGDLKKIFKVKNLADIELRETRPLVRQKERVAAQQFAAIKKNSPQPVLQQAEKITKPPLVPARLEKEQVKQLLDLHAANKNLPKNNQFAALFSAEDVAFAKNNRGLYQFLMSLNRQVAQQEEANLENHSKTERAEIRNRLKSAQGQIEGLIANLQKEVMSDQELQQMKRLEHMHSRVLRLLEHMQAIEYAQPTATDTQQMSVEVLESDDLSDGLNQSEPRP